MPLEHRIGLLFLKQQNSMWLKMYGTFKILIKILLCLDLINVYNEKKKNRIALHEKCIVKCMHITFV